MVRRDLETPMDDITARIPSLKDLIFIVAVAFGAVGLSHAIADPR